jgi:hypothetical protein
MNPETQAVYDAAMTAARRLGREGVTRDELVPAVLDSREVAAALPTYGVGNLPPTLIQDMEREYLAGKES